MTEQKNANLTNPDFWIRLVYMILFGLLTWLARVVVILIAIVQAVIVAFAGEGNANLRSLGDSIASWTRQTYLFLVFASEQKPYPFQEWPAPSEASAVTETAPEKVSETTSEADKPEAVDDTASGSVDDEEKTKD